MSNSKAFQDYYPDHLNHCYGCGRLNKHGLRIKSYWNGDQTICHFTPHAYHTAIPGYVYGGVIASIVDCHSTGSAAAAAYRAEGRPMDSLPPLRFLTASLHVDYLRPTPIDGTLELRSTIDEIKGRKVIVATEVFVDNKLCAQGRVVAVQAPDHLFAER
jgi:acyl-coenzyme A thioesterase PaaI-like protein